MNRFMFVFRYAVAKGRQKSWYRRVIESRRSRRRTQAD